MAEFTPRESYMPDEATFRANLAARHRRGRAWQIFYYFSVGIAIAALVVLFLNVINEAIGTIATVYEIDPDVITEGRPLEELSDDELRQIMIDEIDGRLPVVIRDNFSQVDPAEFQDSPLNRVIPNGTFPEGLEEATLREIRERDDATEVLADIVILNTNQDQAITILNAEVFRTQIVASYPLFDTIFNYDQIVEEVSTEFPEAEITRYYSWLSGRFLSVPMSSTPALAGIRTAFLGSLGLMVLVIATALPIGVGAALYLNEYASDNWLNRLIETNVRNLAGVPSIIYGMLGLAIFVRVLAPFTSGLIFGYGVDDPNVQRIVENISNDLSAEILIEENEAGELIISDVNADNLDQATAETLLETFQYYGTPSLSNVGSKPIDELADALARDLNLELNDIPTNDDGAYPLEDGVSQRYEVLAGDISTVEFNALLESLENINRFVVNGRSLISAALTLSLLILPIVIINAQEALRAVPWTIREASFGLGATQWQTIWRQVLPAAIPGIMTGMILSVSRAVGETAPLIVVGASTFILTDPNSPFSKFTVLPIQVYSWTSRPQDQFRDIAAAAILVLLVVILTLNAVANFVRNRYAIKY
jgi:ABC-type phosphate transport system permease subunit